MTENEQIQEMARIICGVESGCNGCVFDSEKCFEHNDAKRLYAKGYRKVERGEWIENGIYNNCSRCGGEVARYDANDYYQDFALCPNCGADMRGKGNEDTERA